MHGSCRFLKSLAHTASNLTDDWAEFEFLHVNLGPHWKQCEAQQLFTTVVDVDNTGWERPPGLGTCALEKSFFLCHVIHNWLRSSDDHGVVSPQHCSSTECLRQPCFTSGVQEHTSVTSCTSIRLTGMLLTCACRCCMCMASQEWGFTVPI